MGDAQQRQAHIKDAIDFFDALDNGQLPAVALSEARQPGRRASGKLQARSFRGDDPEDR